MRVFVLGGTLYLGRAIVEAAGGHELTLLNRGETSPELHPEVEKLRDDRAGKLEALRGRSFDACIDVSARESDWVRRTLEAVDAPYYLFVSSVSAYAGMLKVDNRRAVAAGLTFRPLEDTVLATLERAEPVDGVGLTPEREAQLLELARG